MTVLFKEFNKNKEEEELVAVSETNINSDFWYHSGYYNAGEILFENWSALYKNEGDHISIDAIVYPIYYCYRHSVEVLTKKILRTIVGQNCKSNHNIFDLFLKLIENDIKIPQEVKDFINELNKIDPSFTRFRYDTKKSGDKNQPLEVDLVGMVTGFRFVYKFLSNIWDIKYENDNNFNKNHYNRFKK
ncbi:MAG: hypothetical protein WC414_04115 [Patescibacteria group bacterium]